MTARIIAGTATEPEHRVAPEDERLKTAAQIAHVGSWEWDMTTNQVSWSDELFRIFGIAAGDGTASFDGYLERIHPDDLESVVQTIARSRETRRAFAFDHRIVRPDGSVRVLHCRGDVVCDDDGMPLRMFGTAQDVTERARAHEEAILVHSIALSVGEAADLDEALAGVIQRVCERAGWPFGRIWLVAEGGTHLVPGPSWHVPDGRLAELEYVSRTLTIQKGEGLPGRVWAEGRSLWLAAFGPGAPLPASQAVIEAGLTSCMLFPVLAQGHVEAVLEFFVFELREEDEALVRFAETISAMIGSHIRRKRAEAALRASEEKFRGLLEAAPDAIVILGEDGRIQLVNSQTEFMFGYGRAELIGRQGDTLFPPRCSGVLEARAARLSERSSGSVAGALDLVGLRADGGEFSVEVSLSPLRTNEGLLFSLSMRDASQRKRADKALRDAHDGLSTLVNELETQNREIRLYNEMSDLLQSCVTIDELGSAVRQSVTQLFPTGSGAMYVTTGTDLLEVVASWGAAPPPERTFAAEQCWAFRRTRAHAVEDPQALLHCAHVELPGLASYVCVPLMAYGDVLGILHWRLGEDDMPVQFGSERRRAVATAERLSLAVANFRLREALRNQSMRDPLTGLYNRRQMEESLKRVVSEATTTGTPVGLIMIDVDGLKSTNDALGHEAGDVMLRAVAGVLSAHVRAGDIACRYGGDEFMMVLCDAPPDATIRRAEELRKALAQPDFDPDGAPAPRVTVSLGVASFPIHGDSPPALIRAADRALYRAKMAGRNQTVVADDSSRAAPD